MMAAKDLGKVAVLMGGKSSEREVSISSGTGVLNALRSQGVNAEAFDPGKQPLSELALGGYDRAFNMLHGLGGEDGTIQGVLEWMQIPYTGSGRFSGVGSVRSRGNHPPSWPESRREAE